MQEEEVTSSSTMYSSKNLVRGHVLTSPVEDSWRPLEVSGSLYLTQEEAVNKCIESRGGDDWRWLTEVAGGDAVVTAKEGLDWARRISAVLKTAGLCSGDVVHSVVGSHRMSYSVSLGVWRLGGVASQGDVNLSAEAIAHQISDTKAKILLCSAKTASLVREALERHGASPSGHIPVFCVGDSPQFPDLLGLAEKVTPGQIPEAHRTSNPAAEPAVILWSSGTTGRPKGILHSHTSFLNYCGHMQGLFEAHSSLLLTTCFYHASGFVTTMLSLIKGKEMHYTLSDQEEPSPEEVIDMVVQIAPKELVLPAHLYVQISECDLLKSTPSSSFDSVKRIIPAGSAVPPSCRDVYEEKMKNLEGVFNVYGQQEMGIVTTGPSFDRLGCIFPLISIKIVDLETGEPLGPGEVGEICGKSEYGMMLGYVNLPGETADYFDSDGYGRTGDLGYYDENGDLFYVDRLKAIMKYRNNHVSPTELEAVMQRHPAVKESLAFGRPDPTVMEVITMVVVLNPGHKATQEELLEHVNGQVVDYKRVRGGIIFKEALPRNGIGKLLRREAKEWALTLT